MSNASLRTRVPLLLANLDFLPPVSRVTHQPPLYKILWTFGAFVGYCVLSLLPVYGFRSNTDLVDNPLWVDQSKAISVVRNNSAFSPALFEKILTDVGGIVLPANPRHRDRFLRGMRILLLLVNSLVVLPVSLMTGPLPPHLTCTLGSEGRIRAAMLAGVCNLLGGIIYLGLENFTDSYTNATTTRTLFHTVDLLNQLVRRYATYRTDWCRTLAALTLVVASYALDSLLSPQLILEGGGKSTVNRIGLNQLLSTAEYHHRVLLSVIQSNLVDKLIPFVLAGLRILVRTGLGYSVRADEWCAYLVCPAIMTDNPWLQPNPRTKLGNLSRLNAHNLEVLLQKLVYYGVKIPLIMGMGPYLAPQSYNATRLVQTYVQRGYRVNGHSNYPAAIRDVDRVIAVAMQRALWLIPIQMSLDSFRIFGAIDPSQILTLATKLNSLYEDLEL